MQGIRSRKSNNNTNISFVRLHICRLSSSFSSLLQLSCYHPNFTGPALVDTAACEVLHVPMIEERVNIDIPTKYFILSSRKSSRVLPLSPLTSVHRCLAIHIGPGLRLAGPTPVTTATVATHIGPCLGLTGPIRVTTATVAMPCKLSRLRLATAGPALVLRALRLSQMQCRRAHRALPLSYGSYPCHH